MLAVRLPVEVLRAQELRDLDDRLAVDQDRAENRLLGLQTVRRQTVDHCGQLSIRVVTPRVSARPPSAHQWLTHDFVAAHRRWRGLVADRLWTHVWELPAVGDIPVGSAGSGEGAWRAAEGAHCCA